MNKPQFTFISLTIFFSIVFHIEAQDHLWKFDEGSGVITFDSGKSDNPANAILYNATWQEPVSGRTAVQLDGTDGSYVSFGNSIGQFRTQDFTVALWMQTTDTTLSLSDIIGNREDPGHGNFFSVRMTDDGYVIVEIDQDASGTNYIGIRSRTNNLNDGQWHYIVITRVSEDLSLYVDGRLSASGSANGVANIDNGREFKLGRSLVDPSMPRFSPVASYHDIIVSSAAVTFSSVDETIFGEVETIPGETEIISVDEAETATGEVEITVVETETAFVEVEVFNVDEAETAVSEVEITVVEAETAFVEVDMINVDEAEITIFDEAERNFVEVEVINVDEAEITVVEEAETIIGEAEITSNEFETTTLANSCWLNSYGRGIGFPCEEGYSGNGPVCWASCPTGLFQCRTLCLQNQEECTAEMLDIGTKVAERIFDLVLGGQEPLGQIISVAESAAEIVGDLDYPVCV